MWNHDWAMVSSLKKSGMFKRSGTVDLSWKRCKKKRRHWSILKQMRGHGSDFWKKNWVMYASSKRCEIISLNTRRREIQAFLSKRSKFEVKPWIYLEKHAEPWLSYGFLFKKCGSLQKDAEPLKKMRSHDWVTLSFSKPSKRSGAMDLSWKRCGALVELWFPL